MMKGLWYIFMSIGQFISFITILGVQNDLFMLKVTAYTILISLMIFTMIVFITEKDD